MSIGERIKIKRKDRRLTQAQLGTLVNVSSQVISNWERGYTHPNHDDVARLASALDCSTDYLHGRNFNKFYVSVPRSKEINRIRNEKRIKSSQFREYLNMNNEEYANLIHGDVYISEEQAGTIEKLIGISKEKLRKVDHIKVAGQEIKLTSEELKVFEELKKHPVLFHDLASDPEKKIKELLKLYKMKKLFLEEEKEDEYGNGFGDIED